MKIKLFNSPPAYKIEHMKTKLTEMHKSYIDHFRVTSHMTNCVFGRHVGGKTKKNKKSFWKKYVNNIEYNR